VEGRRRRAALARAAELVAAGATIPSELRNVYLDSNFTGAAARYHLRPWPGRVLLLRAHELAFAFRTLDDTYGWATVVGDGLEVIEVPGDHNTVMLGPSAARLADALGRAIEDVSGAEEASSLSPASP
jgi:thioesterase domain-containing protein